MTDPVTILLLPSPVSDDDAAVDACIAAARAEVGADAPVVRAEAPDAVEHLAAAAFVAPIRVGDRWRVGTHLPRLRPLAAHPVAAFVAAGHARVDGDGATVVTVPAPRAPVEPMDLVLHRTVEASAVVVRGALLDADALALLLRPHGDAVLWSRLAGANGMLTSGEIAADVLVDPDRHAAGAGRLDELLAGAVEGDGSGTSTVRRDALRRLYIDREAPDGPVDLRAWLGAGADEVAHRVVEDLQWALERTAEALGAERTSWPLRDPEDAADYAPAPFPDVELLDARVRLIGDASRAAARETRIRRLEAEIYQRDATIARLAGLELEDGARG